MVKAGVAFEATVGGALFACCNKGHTASLVRSHLSHHQFLHLIVTNSDGKALAFALPLSCAHLNNLLLHREAMSLAPLGNLLEGNSAFQLLHWEPATAAAGGDKKHAWSGCGWHDIV